METVSQVNPNFFKSVMDELSTAVLLLNEKGEQIYYNPSFLTYSGLQSSQVSGTGWSRCLYPAEKVPLWNLLSEVRETAMTSLTHSVQTLKSTESIFSRTITVKLVKDQIANFAYLLTFPVPDHQASSFKKNASGPDLKELDLSTFADSRYEGRESSNNLTHTKEQEVQFVKADSSIADLQASNHLKDKILAVISHDLRSPIASLKNLSADFFDEELTAEEKVWVKKNLLMQLEAVSDLTENLLGWASRSFLRNGSQEMVNLNICEVVEQNTILTRPHRLLKNIEIQNNIPEGLRTKVNKDHIDVVIRNLIANAIKYTPFNGKIEVSGTDLNTHIQIRITDTGIGITADQLSKLFTHSHSNTYGTNGEKGTGLGLLLCKEYVEASGGKIFISSKVNVGTTVILHLPCAGNETERRLEPHCESAKTAF